GAGAGAINLQNSGKLIGDVALNATENDTITNNGNIGGTVHLGGGNDVFNGAGGTSGAMFGEAGVDTLTGGSAADAIDGGIGNDTLKGGLGADVLAGGAGNDHLIGGLCNDQPAGGTNSDFLVV